METSTSNNYFAGDDSAGKSTIFNTVMETDDPEFLSSSGPISFIAGSTQERLRLLPVPLLTLTHLELAILVAREMLLMDA